MRSRLSEVFKLKGTKKQHKTEQLLGCNSTQLKEYLESRFESWMTWDNRGLYNGNVNHGWDVDHIIPLSSATTEEELIKLCHYTNLQPLCSYTNRCVKKINKMKKSELQKIIREELRKVTNEGLFTTSLTPEQVQDLTAIVTKIDELKAAMDKAYKSVRNRTIEQMIQASPGQPELNTLRARMTSIYQLKDL